MLKEFKLSAYQDYGPLGNKEQIHLVRNNHTGKICVKKILGKEQQEIISFRRSNASSYFPKIVEVIEDEEETILIEEYIEGINLEEYMMGEAIPESEAVKIARQICEALLLLHRAAPMIIYRDLKAENVMITPEGNIKLVDFDISRKYQDGKKRDTRLLGTAEYAAPEQFGYFQTDNRTDIYAFGVLFNYMLTGKFPVEYVTEGTYTEVVRKCIELEPAKRYQSVEEILAVFASKEAAVKIFNIRLEAQNQEDEEISWTLPGFRSKTPWKMVVAVLGYGLMLYMGLTIEFTDSSGNVLALGELWLNRFFFTLAMIATVLFNFNYGGILNNIPIFKRCPMILRIAIFVISGIVFIVLGACLTAAFEFIFRM